MSLPDLNEKLKRSVDRLGLSCGSLEVLANNAQALGLSGLCDTLMEEAGFLRRTSEDIAKALDSHTDESFNKAMAAEGHTISGLLRAGEASEDVIDDRR